MKQLSEDELKEAVYFQIGQQAATWICVALGISVLIIPSLAWAAIAMSAILMIAGICLSTTWYAQRKLVEYLLSSLSSEIDIVNMQMLTSVLLINILPENLKKRHSEDIKEFFRMTDCSDVLGKETIDTTEDIDKVLGMLALGVAKIAESTVELEKISPPIIKVDKKVRIVRK